MTRYGLIGLWGQHQGWPSVITALQICFWPLCVGNAHTSFCAFLGFHGGQCPFTITVFISNLSCPHMWAYTMTATNNDGHSSDDHKQWQWRPHSSLLREADWRSSIPICAYVRDTQCHEWTMVNNNNNNNTLIYIAPACRMTSEALITTHNEPTHL